MIWGILFNMVSEMFGPVELEIAFSEPAIDVIIAKTDGKFRHLTWTEIKRL